VTLTARERISLANRKTCPQIAGSEEAKGADAFKKASLAPKTPDSPTFFDEGLREVQIVERACVYTGVPA
jgi:hypothetical protein